MVRDGLYYGVSLLVVAVIVYFGTHWISLTAIPFLLAVFFLCFSGTRTAKFLPHPV